jgi:PAS domain S-box-containing protein
MNLNKLLVRQIKKFIPDHLMDDPAMEKFLQAVNDSYNAYERDNELSNRAFDISEQEYKRLTDELKHESRLREISIKSLKEAVRELDEHYMAREGDDLIDILQYLKTQIYKRTEAENSLTAAANRLSSLIQNIQAGILVEDENRKVVLTNQLFCDIFCSGRPVESMEGRDCSMVAEETKELALDPVEFVTRIQTIIAERKLVINENILFSDGRIFERDYIPVFINHDYKGHLWKYRDITATMRTQNAIAESEKRHRLIMNSSLDAIVHIDVQGNIKFWNKQAETIFGWSAGAVMGKELSGLIIPPEYRDAHRRGMAHFLQTGEGPVLNKALELTAINSQGLLFPVELAIIPIRENDSVFFCGFIRDISARKKAEEKIKANEELLQFALEGAGDGIWEYNFASRHTYTSDQSYKMLGITGTAKKPDWRSRVHPEEIYLFETLENDYNSGLISSHKKEYRVKHLDGHYIWIMDRAQVVTRDVYGKPLRLVGTHTDITRLKETENELRRLSLVAMENKNGVVFTKADGSIFWFNEGFQSMTGYTRDEILGKTPIQLLKGEQSDKNKIREMLDLFYSGQSFSLEMVVHKKDQTAFWIKTKGYPVFDDARGFNEYFTVIEDITQEKERENRLRLLSQIAEDNIHAVVTTDENSLITWSNKSFTNMTGYELSEIIGKSPAEILHGPDTNKVTIHYLKKQIIQKRPFTAELINYRKNGEKYWVRIKGQPIFDEKGNMNGFFALEEDITREKESEKQIREFENRFRKALERVGDNAWEHNFKTGKTYFSNTSHLLLDFNIGEHVDNAAFWWSRIHPDDLHMLKENDRAYQCGQRDNHSLEYRMLNKNSEIRWVLDRGVVIERDENMLPVRIAGTHTDITDRKQAEQYLLFKEEKYRSIIANMNLGLLEVNREEVIQFANNSFCEMSGYTADELIGRKAADLFTRGESAEIAETKNELRKKGVSDAYEIGVLNKQGESKWWLVSGAPRYNDQGHLVGSIGIHLDITAQKNLELELLDARESAEQSAAAKEIFLANMSHEIRTPMNAIIGMGRQLHRTNLDDQQQFYLETINKAAEHLLVLINDILDISKIEAGKLNLEHIGFRPDEVINHCIQVMEHKAEEKGLKLVKETNGDDSVVFIGDPYRLTQVILNLMSNAIKFTDEGHVTISSLLQPVTDGRQLIVLSVKDTGIGMDAEFLSAIFRKFTQEEKSTARKYGGTGLGMSISKQLTELMNGHIDVSSRKGEGTTITLTIPFTVGTENDIPESKGQVIDSSILKDKKILLVEDNEMNRLVATTLLDNYGALVGEAHNGAEAVRALKDGYYDLVLMDVQMPVLNGLDATHIIRQEVNQFVPIIALTANAIKGEAEKCLKAGMNDYISKPFEEVELINAIAKWLGERPTTLITLQHTDMDNKPASRLYELSKLEQIAGNNKPFIQKMIRLFIQQAPSDVAEMAASFASGDMVKVKSVAHRMKPSIDNLGISSLYDLIREIETYNEKETAPALLQAKITGLRQVIISVADQLKEELPVPME